MTVSWARDRRLHQSLFASIALHAGIALLIPATIILSGNTSAVETLTFVRVMRVQIVRPQAVESPARAVAAVAAPIVRIAPPTTAARDARGAKHVRANETTQHATAPTVGAIQRDANANAQPAASAAPVAATQVAPSQTPRERIGGYMPLGAEDPVPVLDPSVRTALQALGVKVTLVITVDENGRTTNVVFQPPLDAPMQARIVALLESAHWDPATCGAGVPCEAKATITL